MALSHGVLHIVVDDLRPELGAYGLPNRSTPTIDAIADSGVTFDRAFAQIAVCGPSRNSFMTGRRPDRSRTWNFINNFREDHPEWTTLPGLFLRAGGVALGVGKTFHPMMPPAYDGNRSWSAPTLPYYNPCWNTADRPSAVQRCEGKAQSFPCDGGLPCAFCPVDIKSQLDKWIFGHGDNVSVANEFCEVDAWEDTLTVHAALSHLRHDVVQAAAAGLPWYLAVGLHKPHMPWQASAADWAQHPLESVSLPTHQQPPNHMPEIAFHFSESTEHSNPYEPIPPSEVQAARRAYRAAVTGMDRKLGALMDELDTLGLAPSTAVVFHSDHGWHLGEGGMWRKFTNFEAATRVPLIVRAPWLGSLPRRSDALVELVDVLPTIAELAGVTLPSDESYDGQSLVPLLSSGEEAEVEATSEGDAVNDAQLVNDAQPPVVTDASLVEELGAPVGVDRVHGETAGFASTRTAAFSQYPRRVKDPSRPWYDNSIIHHARSSFTHMGYSVRTPSWRYTEWVAWNGTALTPMWEEVVARELYDHRNESSYPTDFDAGELENVASHVELAATVEALSAAVRKQFGAEPAVAASV